MFTYPTIRQKQCKNCGMFVVCRIREAEGKDTREKQDKNLLITSAELVPPFVLAMLLDCIK